MDRVVELHNAERSSPLATHRALMAYAQKWASTMAASGSLRHSPMSDISALGFSPVAENIACGQDDEEAVMLAWMGSAGHRRNITNENLDSIGVGVAIKGDRLYWCCVFGRRDGPNAGKTAGALRS